MKNRILVVDDEPGLRHMLERVLGRRYDLALAATPEEAIVRCREHDPEAAILDIRMPGMDGFELMASLKQIDPHLEVILMTGSFNDSDEKLIRAIREKAFYFIQKPFDREVLLALVDRCLELHRLAADNRKHLARLERELSAARAFQRALLPEGSRTLDPLRFEARYRPCVELGGDFYDFCRAGDHVAFLAADVTGHGAAAAMLTGMVKSAFQSLVAEGAPPREVVRRIATSLATLDESRFVTVLCARFDPAEGRLEVVNAGHPPPMLRRPDGSVERLARTGPMVCAGNPELDWRTARVPFGPGSTLVVYTDGLVEARNTDDLFFGEERLEAPLLDGPLPAAELLDRVLAALDAFASGRPVEDDVTLLAVEHPP